MIRPPACSAALNNPHSGLEGGTHPMHGPTSHGHLVPRGAWAPGSKRGGVETMIAREAPERYLRYLNRGRFTWAGRRSGANLIQRAAQRRFLIFTAHPGGGGPGQAGRRSAPAVFRRTKQGISVCSTALCRALQEPAGHGMIQRGSAPPSRKQPNLAGPSRMQRNSARGCQHP